MVFSILIATYNSAKHIKPCLESINNQTFKDFELIIMDGKSSDKTLDIIREICPFAKVTSERDSGIYNALNNGLKKIKGKWLYILGSDDCFANENVLMEVNSNIEDNLSMIYGNIITKKQNVLRTLKMKDPLEYRNNNNLTPPIFHQTVFIKSEKLIKTGQFQENFLIHADHFMISQFFNFFNTKYIDKNICIYSQEGFSELKFSKLFLSMNEQLRISLFFKSSLIVFIKNQVKNLLRATYNKFKKYL